MMESLLLGAGLPHAWQGAVLVVREADEQQVDEFVDAVVVAAAPALAADAPRVAYELGDFDDDYVTQLTAALDAAGIVYGFDDDGDLEVAAADEARVDGLFDKLADGTDGDDSSEFGSGLDGVDAHDVLSRLFGASDRLQRNPRDRKGNRNLTRGVDEIRQLALPFGFEARTWRAVLNQAEALADIVDSDATQGRDSRRGGDHPRHSAPLRVAGSSAHTRQTEAGTPGDGAGAISPDATPTATGGPAGPRPAVADSRRQPGRGS